MKFLDDITSSTTSPSTPANMSSALPSPGRTLLTLVALVTSTGCFLADWNETHIYNPTWPAHAKFHNGQTMSMGALLGVAALWYLHAPSTSSSSSPPSPNIKSEEAVEVKRAADLQNLRTVVLLDTLYWVTQASGYVYPGSWSFDPVPGRVDPGYWWQAKLEVVLLGMVAVGWWLERRRILAE